MSPSRSEASSRGSEDSTSDLNEQGCESSGSARLTPTAEPSSLTIGPTSPATRTSETSDPTSPESISSAEASPVSPSPSPAKASRKKIRAGSGPSSPELLAFYCPATSSWRTYPDWQLEDSETLLVRLPRSGMTRSGTLFRLPRSVPRTLENDSLLWRTPTAQEAGQGERFLSTLRDKDGGPPRRGKRIYNPKDGKHIVLTLNRQVALWPTPTARLGTARGAQAKRYTDPRRSNDLDDAVADSGSLGQLNPTWVAWLMGFPIDFLNSVPWETRSSRKSRSSSGGSS